MNLNLYDRDLNRISIIGTNYKSCLWNEGYNSTEPFTLELGDSDEYKKKFKKDYYIGRDDRPTLMVIKNIVFNPRSIVVSGFQASRVLDDVAFIGTIEENANIDDAVYEAYNNSTRYHNLEMEKSGLSEEYPGQLSNKSILSLLETMCEKSDCGFHTIRRGKSIITKLYKPEQNENLVFSQEFGNLKLSNIKIYTEKEKNFAFVLGEEQAEERKVVTVDLTDGEPRKEVIIDARDVQRLEDETDADYETRLMARGLEKLLEMSETFAVTFTPNASDFGKRYDLGDVLTVRLADYGLSLTARVVRFSQKAQENLVETTVEVGKLFKIKRR